MTPLEIYELAMPVALLFVIGLPSILWVRWSARRLEAENDSADAGPRAKPRDR